MSKPQTYPTVVRRWTAHVCAGRRYEDLQVGRAEEYEDGALVLTFVTLPVHNSTWDAKVWLRPCEDRGRHLSSPARRSAGPTPEEGEMRDREHDTDGFAGMGRGGGPIRAQQQDPPPPVTDPPPVEGGHGAGSGGGRGEGGGEGGTTTGGGGEED